MHSFVPGPIEKIARDGEHAGQGEQYPMRYVLVPRYTLVPPHGLAGYPDPVDVVFMVSRRQFQGTPIPLAARNEIITHGNAPSFYQTQATVVGYSNNRGTATSRRRAVELTIEGRTSADFVMSGNGWEGACSGDSGGPVLYSFNGAERVIGVISQGGCRFLSDAGTPGGDGGLDSGLYAINTHGAFIPYEFLDAQCPLGTGDWEDCALDMDRDGVTDATDNCPLIANASQTNCNPGYDVAIWGQLMGDACDPSPCADTSTAGPGHGLAPTVTKSAGHNLPAGMAFTAYLVANKADVTARPTGYQADTTTFGGHPVELTAPGSDATSSNLTAEYCACHKIPTIPPGGSFDPGNPTLWSPEDCDQSVCMSNGSNPGLDIDADTGYQRFNWKISDPVPQECTRKNLDSDPPGLPKAPNECEDPLPGILFARLHGSANERPALCVDANHTTEPGCQQDDYRDHWSSGPQLPLTISWDWRSQDYPHPTLIPQLSGPPLPYHYDPTQTVKARARVRLRPLSVPSNHNWTFSAVSDLEPHYQAKLTKPLYQFEAWRWHLPLTVDPDDLFPPWSWAPIDRGTPTAQVAASFNWNLDWTDPQYATRGLLATPIPIRSGLATRSVGARVHDADPYHAIQTVGFASCQQGEAAFLFGGKNGHDALQCGLWFASGPSDGQPTIERIGPEPGGGAMAMGGGAGSTLTSAKSSTAKATPAFSAWAKKHPPKKSRPAVSALLAKAQAKLTAKKGVAVKTMSASFGADPPAGQMESVLAFSPHWATVTALFGNQGASPGAASPSHVGIFDVVTGTWTSGTADWSSTCGARRWVAAALLNLTELVIYGGDQGSAPVAGLYLVNLDPASLLEGTPPVRLDSGSPDSPGPRARAVMAHDALAEAGAGRLYLYGGVDGSGNKLRDLWAFSFATGQWSLLSDAQTPGAPPAMVPGGLLVRSLDGRVILLSGTDAGSGQVAAYRFEPSSGWTTHDWPDTP